MSDCDRCRVIGGLESAMGPKSPWLVEWTEWDGRIYSQTFQARDVEDAIRTWSHRQSVGMRDQAFILGIRKE